MPLGTRATASRSRHALPVVGAYRPHLTAAVLRRMGSNVVDTLTADGKHRRAVEAGGAIVVVTTSQAAAGLLEIEIDGPAETHEEAVATVRRMLGATADVAPFLRAARRVPWLAPLARRMRGVHPPRYPTLWEALVNAIVFQQVSLHAAGAMMARLVGALGAEVSSGGAQLRAFPTPRAIAASEASVFRAAGLSGAKATALRTAASAVASGELDERELERLPSPAAAERLRAVRGIGPWSAALILLRGLGRVDVFPAGDSGVARSLALVPGAAADETAGVLEILGDQRGMLYYHLLLARLEARHELP